MTSQEQEMATRVADAIAKGIAKNLSPNDIARAAIEAMMEPTDAMKVAGGIKLEEMLYGGDPDFTGVIFNDIGLVYSLMIRTALSKGEE